MYFQYRYADVYIGLQFFLVYIITVIMRSGGGFVSKRNLYQIGIGLVEVQQPEVYSRKVCISKQTGIT